MQSNINTMVIQLLDEAIKMHLEVTKQTKSLQILMPDLTQAYKVMMDPRINQVTALSLLVFLKRFAPGHSLKASDIDCCRRYLGISSKDGFQYSSFFHLVYPEGIQNTLDNLKYVESMDNLSSFFSVVTP
jgi:hypothetical protein